MPVPLLLALTLPLTASVTRLDVAAAAESQVAGGVLPVELDAPSEPGVELSATPMAGVWLHSSRTSFQLSYLPAAYYRLPNVASLDRALLFHEAVSNFRTQFSRRTELTANLRGQAGELSYNRVQGVLDPGSGVIDRNVVDLALARGGIDLSHQLASLHRISVGIDGGARGALDQSSAEQGPVLPTSFNWAAAVEYGFQFTPTDEASVRAGYEYFEVQDGRVAHGPRFLGGWTHDFSSVTSIDVQAGANLLLQQGLDEQADDGEAGGTVIPVALLAHRTLWRIENRTWRSAARAGLRGFFDQAAAVYRPQVFVDWGLAGQIGHRWGTELTVFAATSVASEPSPRRRFETFLGLRAPSTYRIDRNLRFQFGVSSVLRAPHFERFDDGRVQGEVVGFLGLRFNVGTDRLEGAWL